MLHRLLFVLMAAMLAIGCQRDEPSQPPEPTDVVEPGDNEPLGAFNLRSNQIRTRHMFDGSVTAGKIAVESVTVTVTAASAAATTSADTDLAGGLLLGCHPATNQDQHVDNVVLNANGSITLTLAANATANNVFSCKVLRPNTRGVN